MRATPFLLGALLLAGAARADLPGETIILPARVGDITFTHKAHFKRAKDGCRTCHGPGKAQKIEGFLLASAHRLCLGCHRAAAAGPTACKGCHVKKEME